MSSYSAAPPSLMWNDLRGSIYQIVKFPSKGVEPHKFVHIYTLVYNHCIARTQSNANNAASIQGKELYTNLQELLIGYMNELLVELKGLMNIDLLLFYVREWSKFTKTAKFLDHLFHYLNRHWVKRRIDDNQEGVYRIHTMCLVVWKDSLFNKITDSLTNAVLKQIRIERDGESIDRSMLKQVLDSYVALDITYSDPGVSSDSLSVRPNSVYRLQFENNFFTETQAYYKAESAGFLADNSVTEYMKKAEIRLNEEEERVKMYLHESTLSSLLALSEQTLIFDHEDKIKDEFGSLLSSHRNDDMERMYKLVSRKPERLDTLRNKLEVHVRQAGLDAVSVLGGSVPDSNSGAAGDDDEEGGAGSGSVAPKAYVDALLHVHDKFLTLVNLAFQADPGFIASLDKACREFINRNAVCERDAKTSPRLLAIYCDSLLRKSAKNPEEAELEQLLTSIMIVFKYIEDKDVFQGFYSKKLSTRLVQGKSASMDAEETMIKKLKDACGHEYTTKLQRMFTDIGLSKDINTEFMTRVTTTTGYTNDLVDFYVMVLTDNTWPFGQQPSEFRLPTELERTFQRFTEFYQSKHSGRKLMWQFNHSRGEITARFPKSKIPYQFGVHMYQMGILLQYNTTDSLTYQELSECTGLAKEYLTGHLGPLTKAKILLIKPDGASIGDPKTSYVYNTEYRNKKTRFNLNMRIRAEEKAETDETNKHIEEDRKILIQAAIVRVMKARKKYKHTPLIQEVIDQLKSRFKPNVADIKKQIDVLIEREYIERSDGEKDSYTYLA